MTAQQLREQKVKEVADQFRTEGYDVRFRPEDPGLLGDYRPDLIATRGNEHVVIQVKNAAERLPPAPFQEIASRLRAQPGWRFLLLSATPETMLDEAPATAATTSPAELRDRLARAEKLLVANESEASFLLSWSALEGTVRRHLEQQASPLERLGLTAALKHLYSFGELTIEQLNLLLEGHTVWNQLVHGLKPPPGADLNRLASEIQTIAKQLHQTWPNESVSTSSA